MNVLDVENLVVEYRTEGVTRAVDGVSFQVPAGKTVAVVGESGSGKSTISQAVMGLLPPAARIAGGRLMFHDQATGESVDLASLKRDGSAMRSCSRRSVPPTRRRADRRSRSRPMPVASI